MSLDDPKSEECAARVYDLIGIGFGPSNIALAIALEERDMLRDALFLESNTDFCWHPGMMFAGTDIQNNPLRDLVTPRNPRSPYGFLSYLESVGRLFDYLNLDAPYPPRSEYVGYVRWAADQFRNRVRLGTAVSAIDYVHGDDGNRLLAVTTDGGRRYLARSVSLATGRSAHVPEEFAPFLGERVFHLTEYLDSVVPLIRQQPNARIVVLGASQSAVEIVLDLLTRAPGTTITSVARGFGFKQKDLSPFTELVYFPEFVDYFHEASEASQESMTKELWRSNYGAADHDVISDLSFRMYEEKISGEQRVRLMHNRLVEDVGLASKEGPLQIRCLDRHSGESASIEADAVILATGFRNFGRGEGREAFHPLLESVSQEFEMRSDGGVDVRRDYRARTSRDDAPPIFLNGLCESTHGFGDAGSFSLLSIRSDTIAKTLERVLQEGSAVDAH